MYFPMENAYPEFGDFRRPGLGVDLRTGPLANHLVPGPGEADEIDYPTQSGYRTSTAQAVFDAAPPYRTSFRAPPRSRVSQHVGVGGMPPGERFVNVRSVPQTGGTVPLGPLKENSVVDYNLLQGTNNPTDLSTQVLRDINFRYVTIENSSYRPVGVGVTTYYSGTTPHARFLVEPQVTRHVGLNSQGGPAQYLWPLDPETGAQVGSPQIFERTSNQFVLRDGINGWDVQTFFRPSYRAAF